MQNITTIRDVERYPNSEDVLEINNIIRLYGSLKPRNQEKSNKIQNTRPQLRNNFPETTR